MCGRISLKTPAHVLAELFGVAIPFEITPRYNIAPTQRTLIVRAGEAGREASMARWGFIPPWRKADEKGPEPINARSESAPTSQLFAPAIKARRCVVPASGFYEWQAIKGERAKRPYHIEPTGAEAFALAGLWSRWAPRGAEPLVTFTILTCAPNETMRRLHNRMPVILPFDVLNAWLDPAIDDAVTVAEMLRPALEESIVVHEVSAWVNSPAHDDAKCAAPVSHDAMTKPPQRLF